MNTATHTPTHKLPNVKEISDGHAVVGSIYLSGPLADELHKAARAIATHDELVAALRKAVEWADLNKQRAGTLDVDGMRAALAKAGAA